MPLSLGPGARPAASLEVGQHRLLPLVKALAVHVSAAGAELIIAGDAHGVAKIVEGDQHGVVVVRADLLLGAQALAGGHAAPGHAGVLGIDAQEALNLAEVAARGHARGGYSGEGGSREMRRQRLTRRLASGSFGSLLQLLYC